MGPGAKFALVAGFLITGSINTLTKKFQFLTCADSLDRSNPEAACPLGQEEFNRPWSQNILMFIGESLLIFVFCLRASSKRQVQAREMQESLSSQEPQDSRPPFYIFLLPACCDVMGTGVGGMGMLYVSASVWQMMRGSIIIFTCIFTRLILKRALKPQKLVAVCIATCGLCLVGLSAILDGGAGEQKNIFLGIVLVICSQCFAACQMVVEELFVNSYKAPPEQVVGSEGCWGIMIMIVILTVMYFAPGPDNGSYESALDSIHMLSSSGALQGLVGCYLISIASFNFFGVTIAGKLSSVTRTINDTLRTTIVWTVQIILYYATFGQSTAPLRRYGTAITQNSVVQLAGFVCLLLGSLVDQAVIKLPCINYEAPPTTTPLGQSLQPDGGSTVSGASANRAGAGAAP